jgi:hypothetical protein
MEKELEITFLDIFGKIEDPWSSRNHLHTISKILLTTLCAAIWEAEGWQGVRRFWKDKNRLFTSTFIL